MLYKSDLHVHSEYSKDSKSKLNDILNECKKKKISCIAISDHNNIEGSLAAKKLAKVKKIEIEVIISSEIKTDAGDVLGYHLTDEIKPDAFEVVIDKIKSQGGYVCIAHPYDKFQERVGVNIEKISQNLNKIDFFELNARSLSHFNKKTKRLSFTCKKNLLASSDAHMCFEIGNFYTILKNIETMKVESKKAYMPFFYPFFPLVRTKIYKMIGV